MKKLVLPKDTNISNYFKFEGKIFEQMVLPDDRVLVKIVHTWGDGEIMNYGFQYSDGITRFGINPLQIVGIYKKDFTNEFLETEMTNFLSKYNKSEMDCGTSEERIEELEGE